MDHHATLAPGDIRRARRDNMKMRERDLAAQLGISEAQLVAAHCGEGVVRIEPDVATLLNGLEAVGEVMALTRNESAVHEKIGTYEEVSINGGSALVLGEQIDLRIFPKAWAHGFAVEKRDGDAIRRSLQFFDAAGDAIHKVHLRPASNLSAYEGLVARMISADQSPELAVAAGIGNDNVEPDGPSNVEELRNRWSAMTDVHQFVGILRAMKLTRHQAVSAIGDDFAWPLDLDALQAMFANAVNEQLPIMCFVGNRGCIQIHSGPIHNVKPMGPWINVMDPTFHLHLRMDHIRELWAVRKPTRDGHVTSLEAYGADKRMIIQFFGQRSEGGTERPDWRMLAEGLPRVARTSAA
jgi:putative hemin transport protein